MAAYHAEALRKARILQRKRAALNRLALAKAQEEQSRLEHDEWLKRTKREQEHAKSKQREEYLKSMGRTGKTGVINANFTNMLEEQKKKISEKDFRHQNRVLKNHCLYQGKFDPDYYFA